MPATPTPPKFPLSEKSVKFDAMGQNSHNFLRDIAEELKKDAKNELNPPQFPNSIEIKFITSEKKKLGSPYPVAVDLVIETPAYTTHYLIPADCYTLLSLAKQILDRFDPLRRQLPENDQH